MSAVHFVLWRLCIGIYSAFASLARVLQVLTHWKGRDDRQEMFNHDNDGDNRLMDQFFHQAEKALLLFQSF